MWMPTFRAGFQDSFAQDCILVKKIAHNRELLLMESCCVGFTLKPILFCNKSTPINFTGKRGRESSGTTGYLPERLFISQVKREVLLAFLVLPTSSRSVLNIQAATAMVTAANNSTYAMPPSTSR